MTFWEYLEAMAHMEATGTAAPQGLGQGMVYRTRTR